MRKRVAVDIGKNPETSGKKGSKKLGSELGGGKKVHRGTWGIDNSTKLSCCLTEQWRRRDPGEKATLMLHERSRQNKLKSLNERKGAERNLDNQGRV